MTIWITIISPNEILRESLKTLLSQVEGFGVQGVSDWNDLENHSPGSLPDLVLFDATWCEADCTDMLGRIREFPGNIRVLVLAGADDLRYRKNQWESAVDAVLSAGSGKKEFEQTIRSVLTGHPETEHQGKCPAEKRSGYHFMDTLTNITGSLT